MNAFTSRLKSLDLQRVALWILMVISLVASMRHVAWLYTTLELGSRFGGWLSAFSFDAGVLLLTMIARRYREGSAQRRFIRAGIYLNAAITIPANIMHGMEHQLELARVNGWMWLAIPFVFSVAVPAMVIFLAEVLSRQESELVREEQKAERRAAKAEAAAGRKPAESGRNSRPERLDKVAGAVASGHNSRAKISAETLIPRSSVGELLTELFDSGRLVQGESGRPELPESGQSGRPAGQELVAE
ncbi:hypothetical protein P0082_00985 [Candidatus Haliotispira prima]|uniref:DUF2637 domain-containing protein n=1 Tax=Candidatus Haliotispira prima TaxID=3034016 RepID=A0ABY8MJS7_9SPIO|nr:hypothetical protein P0082_00985 [Candidatus Haliotispira prima]